MVTGFSNERTSEYMILYDLYNKIKKEFSFFYPFYYHSKRDDTYLSKLNDINDLHLVACFARRPKTNIPFSNRVFISFRRSMFEQANFLRKSDIPVIVGTPLGTAIDNIGFGSACQWFSINAEIDDGYIVYDFINNKIDSKCIIDGIDLIKDDDIGKVLLSAKTYEWTEIIDVVQSWNNVYKHY